jgi:hypothetical protein
MGAYAALGVKSDYSAESIRQFYYTRLAFLNSEREQYHMLRWSVFDYARRCDDPPAVLKYALENMATIRELQAVFPQTEKTEEEKPVTYPNVAPWKRPIERKIALLPDDRREQAQKLWTEIVTIVEAAEAQGKEE